MRTFSKLFAVAGLAVALLATNAASAAAQCSAKVSATFKGKLIITDQQLDLGGEAADVIAAVKKKNLAVITSQEIEDTPTWGFFTAFMSRSPGAKSIPAGLPRPTAATWPTNSTASIRHHHVAAQRDDHRGRRLDKGKELHGQAGVDGGRQTLLATTALATK
jgi:hypothetical protein